jgi:hypothetical protein
MIKPVRPHYLVAPLQTRRRHTPVPLPIDVTEKSGPAGGDEHHAQVLGVRTSALVGEAPSEDHEGPVNPRLAEVERALYTYRSLTPAGGDSPEVVELAQLSQRMAAAWQAWLTSASKYTDVLRVLPDLIIAAERAVYEHERSVAACGVACEVYQLARPVLKHVGRVDLGGLVADRTMRYAEETGDALLMGVGRGIWVWPCSPMTCPTVPST